MQSLAGCRSAVCDGIILMLQFASPLNEAPLTYPRPAGKGQRASSGQGGESSLPSSRALALKECAKSNANKRENINLHQNGSTTHPPSKREPLLASFHRLGFEDRGKRWWLEGRPRYRGSMSPPDSDCDGSMAAVNEWKSRFRHTGTNIRWLLIDFTDLKTFLANLALLAECVCV